MRLLGSLRLAAVLTLLGAPTFAFAQSAGTVILPFGVGTNTPLTVSAAVNAALAAKFDVTNGTATNPSFGGTTTFLGLTGASQCLQVSSTGVLSGTGSACASGGGSGTVTSVAVSGGTTGLTTSGGPITGSGTITLGGQLALTALPSLSANTVLGALTATTPSAQAVPSCSGATNALTWTSGSGFGCNTISTGSNTLARKTESANYTTVAGDNATVILGSGTWTLTFTAPGTLGTGWWEYVQNSGTGNITLTPASGTIDGLSSYVMYPGEVRLIQTNGTAFYSIVVNPFSLTLLSTTTITIPPGYQTFSGIVWGAGGGGGNGSLYYGGGGGAAVPFSLKSASLGSAGASATCTVGAGGNGASTGNGPAGGNSQFGSIYAYGGAQGGGGAFSAGSYTAGGRPLSSAAGADNSGFGGAGAASSGSVGPGSSFYGGGGGGGDTPTSSAIAAGGNSIYGGGGGGGATGSGGYGAGGTSVFGGAGGAANEGTGYAGTQPGGGGGLSTATAGGAGGAGECFVQGGL
jgi:hypothetical protein